MVVNDYGVYAATVSATKAAVNAAALSALVYCCNAVTADRLSCTLVV
jgi:hypothetical protein